MNDKPKFLKRRYFEFRQGATTLTPILSFSNFLMLAYLTISEVIPFWIFVPFFIVTVLISFTLVGYKFRNIQYTTDINMAYEKSTEAAETVVQMMNGLEVIMKEKGIELPKGFSERLEYMRNISRGKA